ncbi:MAG: T9SS C-terminal target domain-containing protein [Sphingobacteriales bacterium]|nr:MAG: T9SS C-terminal target domain-containing protein [Sphingobacteriales bacterium]
MKKNQLIKQTINLIYNHSFKIVSYSSSCIRPTFLLLLMLVLGTQLLLAQQNIATTGIGAIWQDIPDADFYGDVTKTTNVAINDSDISTGISLSDVSDYNNSQAAGITWATAQNGITGVKFYNGTTTDILNENGVFSAGIKLQSSTDGVTWSDVNGWAIAPAYPYDVTASDQIYTFTGATLNNIKGIRVTGKLRSVYFTSWSIKVKEVEVFTGNGEVTPVNLISFDAKVIGNKAKINWSTALEINNKYFELEKSTNGINFSLIAKVPAKGSNSSYTIDDVAPANGVNYYRLTQYDLNGDFKNLGIRQLNFGLSNSEISVYPIPNNGDLYIDLNNFGAKLVKVSISNLNGKIVYSQDLLTTLNKNKYKLNLKQKPNPGIYMLQITAPGLYKTYKVVFQ